MNVIILILLELALSVVFLAIAVMAGIALANCRNFRSDIKKNDGEDSTAFKKADRAENTLGWVVGVSWTLFAIGLVLFVLFIIVEVFGGVEVEAGTAATAEGGGLVVAAEGAAVGEGAAALGEGAVLEQEASIASKAGKAGIKGAKELVAEEESMASQAKKYGRQFYESQKANLKTTAKADLYNLLQTNTKDFQNGLLGFNAFINFDGVFNTFKSLFLIGSTFAIFGLGLLCASAAENIQQANKAYEADGYTYDKPNGHHTASWAAVVGIIPFGIIMIWWIANLFYVSSKKRQATEETKKLNAINAEEQADLEAFSAKYERAKSVKRQKLLEERRQYPPQPAVIRSAPQATVERQQVVTRTVGPQNPVTRPPTTQSTSFSDIVMDSLKENLNKAIRDNSQEGIDYATKALKEYLKVSK